jgi:hypothetical protein
LEKLQTGLSLISRTIGYTWLTGLAIHGGKIYTNMPYTLKTENSANKSTNKPRRQLELLTDFRVPAHMLQEVHK